MRTSGAARLTLALFVFLAASILPAQTPPRPITLEAIYSHGSLIGNPPNGLTWSPDGDKLAFRDDDGQGRLVVLPGPTSAHGAEPPVSGLRAASAMAELGESRKRT